MPSPLSLALPSVLFLLGPALGQELAPGDVGTVLDRITLCDVVEPFERTLGEEDGFGGALAGLGDTNGDGLQEFAVGAPGDFLDRGAVWLFALRANRTIAEYTKLGPVENLPFRLDTGDRFGASVAALGDLDGDGRADLAVGAPGDDDGTTPPFGDTGAVWILFLRGDGSVREERKIGYGDLPGTLAAGDAFGASVAVLGDLDGNGVPDLAVGAPGDDDGGARRGAVWVLFLGADHGVSAARKISALEGGFGGALANNDAFGSALASLGDLDGDGTHELAVGAPGTELPQSSAGAAWILSLASDGTVARETRTGLLPLQEENHQLGSSLTRLDDLDGDGVPELAAGAPHFAFDRQAVFVLLLEADGDVKASARIARHATTLGFGMAVASPGDSNGDGRADLVVGAPMTSMRVEGSGGIVFHDLLPTGAAAGAGLAFHGSNSSLPIAPRFFAHLTDDEYGAAVTALGELDGTGLSEIAVGAPADDDTLGTSPATDRGAVWIHYLTPVGGTRAVKISANQGGLALDDGDRFGSALAGIGDLDGDGRPDLVVGAPGDDDAGTDRGALWVLFLRRNGTVISSRKILAEPGSGPEFLGSAVESIGDLDDDGTPDIAVGTGCSSTGRQVWILFLSPDGTVKEKRRVDKSLVPGLPVNACFGQSLAWLGVSPQAGTRDLVVGAESRTFRIGLDSSGGITGSASHSSTGVPVAAVGDVDGNGHVDTVAPNTAPGDFLQTLRLQLRDASWFGATSLVLTGGRILGVESLGDLSGDGIADAAMTTRFGGGTQVFLLQLGGVASAGFEQRDDGSMEPLENGRQFPMPHPGRTLVISSSGANLGATAFDSTPGGPNQPSQDPDLLVRSGKVLILQESRAPTQTEPGIFDRPNDDPDGGILAFDFPVRVRALSLELMDVDGSGPGATVRLIDDAGRARVYDVPGGFTEDLVTQGGTGRRELDLATLAPQPGFAASATAAEEPGFAPARVVRVEVELFGSGAVDDLVFDPYP